ncbi:MAG TPA: DUF4097 family beta strand repeat-containing protein [Acidobacteriota bacterium]
MNRQRSFVSAVMVLLSTLLFTGAAWASDQTRSFNVSPGESLEVSTRRGAIVLSPWNKNEVVVTVTGIDQEDLPDLQMGQAGNTVRVDFRPKYNDSSKDARFEISLPSQFNVSLRTAGGDIEIRGPMKGDLKGSTSGGNIQLADVDGKADMSTSGGNILAGSVQGDAQLKTSGGNITVGNVGKTLNAKTAGGDINVGDVGGEAIASTAGGNVTVGSVSGSVDLKTAGGNIRLRGGSGKITAKTAGGTLDIKNVSGSIEAKTAGGSIEAELIPSGTGTSRLQTAGGDVRLFLPENARASIEALIRLRGESGRVSGRYEIRADFPHQTLKRDDDAGEIRASYLLNGGGERISLETVNGNIEIRKLTAK